MQKPEASVQEQVLITLFELAQGDVPASVTLLARLLGQRRSYMACVLGELAAEGLIKPETIRLSFPGLVRACGLRARWSGSKLRSTRPQQAPKKSDAHRAA